MKKVGLNDHSIQLAVETNHGELLLIHIPAPLQLGLARVPALELWQTCRSGNLRKALM